MKWGIKGINREIKRVQAGVKKEAIRPANQALRRAAVAAFKSYMKNTPVWSGEAVRNYRIALGRVPTGFMNPVGGAVSWPGGPIPEDVKNELRRGPNEAAALAEARGVLGKSPTQEFYRTIYIKNTIPMNKAALIEGGAAPTPARSRYPGGLTPRARQAAIAAAKGYLK